MSSEITSSSKEVSDASNVDSRSPYYLNNDDNPRMHFVTKPLTRDNFHTRRRSMTMASSAKSKLGFVTGAIPQPANPSDLFFDLWARCNELVLYWQSTLLPVLSTSTQ